MKITRHHLDLGKKKYERLLNLKNLRLERYRSTYLYQQPRKIALDAPLPECKGMAWMSYPSDYLIIIGLDEKGNEETIKMGMYFSEEKANTILAFINEITQKSKK